MSWFRDDVWRHFGRAHIPGPEQFNDDPALVMTQLAKAWSNGARFTDLNQDKGTIERGSSRGIQLMEHATTLFTIAIENMKQDEVSAEGCQKAVELLTTCIKMSLDIKDNGVDLSAVYAVRAEAYIKLKEYQLAVTDGEMAIRCQPLNLMGPYILVEALPGLGEYHKAYSVCIQALHVFLMENSADTQVKFIVRAVGLASKVVNGFRELHDLDNVSDDQWSEAVTKLANTGSWDSVRILLFGTDDMMAIVTSLNANRINISGLLTYCDITPWKQWGQKLALFLLNNGSDYKSLCPQSKHPMHAALRIGLQTDSFDLLRRLFAKHVTATEINQPDEAGNTLLHTACLTKSSPRSTAIKLLLNNSVDAKITNLSGKTAADLLPDDDDDKLTLLKKMRQTVTDPSPIHDSTGTACPGTTTVPDDVTSVIDRIQTMQLSTTRREPKFVISREWSETRVKKWLQDSGLGVQKNKLRQLDGPVLHELKIIQDQCPEVFYKMLDTGFKLEFVELLKISSALRECGV